MGRFTKLCSVTILGCTRTEGSNVNDCDGCPDSQYGTRGARGVAVLTAVVAALASVASAQTLPTNPVPQGSPVPRILPPSTPSVAPAPEVPGLAPRNGDVPNRPVRVTSVAVEGVTAYPQQEIAQMTG